MKRSYWIGLVVIIVVGLGFFGITHKAKAPSANADTTTTQNSHTLTYKGQDGKNALELLKTSAKTETKTDPSLGEYVTSINGVVSGTDSKYWIMYVNGQASSVGASSYATKSTDTIEWKLE